MIEAKGKNGVVRFDGQFVTIAREGMMARLTQGRGEKRIPVGQLSAVQIKPPDGLTNGFIQFSLAGGRESNKMKGGRTMAAAEDENSVIFTKKQEPAFLRLRDAVEQAIANRHAPQQAAAPSALEQLSQLEAMLDAGMIQPDEFEAKRAEIIARMMTRSR